MIVMQKDAHTQIKRRKRKSWLLWSGDEYKAAPWAGNRLPAYMKIQAHTELWVGLPRLVV